MAQPRTGHRTEIQALLSEIMSLAIRLRKGIHYDQEELPAGGQQVLEILELHGDQTVPQIARLRGTSRQNIQILVNKLQADQCVDLVSNPSHKKSFLVRATEKGTHLLQAARRASDSSMALLSAVVPEAEVLSTTETLRRIRQTFYSHTVQPTKTSPPAPVRKKRPRPARSAVDSQANDNFQLPVNLL